MTLHSAVSASYEQHGLLAARKQEARESVATSESVSCSGGERFSPEMEMVAEERTTSFTDADSRSEKRRWTWQGRRDSREAWEACLTECGVRIPGAPVDGLIRRTSPVNIKKIWSRPIATHTVVLRSCNAFRATIAAPNFFSHTFTSPSLVVTLLDENTRGRPARPIDRGAIKLRPACDAPHEAAGGHTTSWWGRQCGPYCSRAVCPRPSRWPTSKIIVARWRYATSFQTGSSDGSKPGAGIVNEMLCSRR